MRNDQTEKTERTAASQRGADEEVLHRFVYLVMEAGRPAAGGMRISLTGVDEIVVGRGDTRRLVRSSVGGRSVLRLDVPDKRMSVEHARLLVHADGLELEDLGSTNGTRVDGNRIEHAPIDVGPIVEAGQSLFLYGEVPQRARWRAGDADVDETAVPHAGFVTLDPIYAARLERLTRVAPSVVPVMLLGETGTGKEVLARALHRLSQRPGPFVAVNCGAIPPALVESTLFGHVRGAFSGALRDEPGLLRSAQFGTLFLDEIGDLPAPSQAAVLRALQEGEVTPVGATRPTKVDVRIVSATHRPLDALMETEGFRRDLYARLAGFTHHLPPVRDRRVDVGVLVAALLHGGKIAGGPSLVFHPDAARALLRYEWPLNVRELEQCLAASSVLAEDGVIRLEDLPAPLHGPAVRPPPVSVGTAGNERDDAVRRELVTRLTESHGNISEVARAMGKARQQIQRWVKRFGLDPDTFKGP